MPQWRCPHCATPQPETARCWVCHRTTTSCATCRHFRRGVAGGLGLCGLDRRRAALRGDEVRECWTAPDPVVEPPPRPDELPLPALADDALPRTDGRSPRTFVLIDGPRPVPVMAAAPQAGGPPEAATPVGAAAPATGRWSLWGDAEP